MSKKQVRGLLDYVTAVNEGEEWEFAPMSETFVYGMGLGASAQATQWAYKGYLLDLETQLHSFKRVGRKKLPQYAGKDCERAMAIWLHVRKLKCQADISLKNRHLIIQMQRLAHDDKHLATLSPAAHGRLESSVSKGKKTLGIDEEWNSELCEKLMSN